MPDRAIMMCAGIINVNSGNFGGQNETLLAINTNLRTACCYFRAYNMGDSDTKQINANPTYSTERRAAMD